MKRPAGFIVFPACRGSSLAGLLLVWIASLSLALPTAGAAEGEADLSGCTIEQANASHSFKFPSGVRLGPGEMAIVARDVDQGDFEAYWGVSLGANVHFFNSGNKLPQINGDETFQLLDARGQSLDGPTPAMKTGQNWQRLSSGMDAGAVTSWEVRSAALSAGAAGPGWFGGRLLGNGRLFISEFSDTTGTGTYRNEFIELLYDAAVTSPTAPNPPTSLRAKWAIGWVDLEWTAPSGSTVAGYLVYRRCPPLGAFQPLNDSPVEQCQYRDATTTLGLTYEYHVRALAGDLLSDPSLPIEITPGRSGADNRWWQYR